MEKEEAQRTQEQEVYKKAAKDAVAKDALAREQNRSTESREADPKDKARVQEKLNELVKRRETQQSYQKELADQGIGAGSMPSQEIQKFIADVLKT
jgi:activator of 2-hydroxyglutaryl-CoA dehydratase